ncbi:hypothetical protein [Streptomyces pilosus]|uniref:Uncharacterized protein n=1 Tax=Streptomyces pilosus TaxID=28893 RepID=A0A918BQ91_9ACTN|nr:hypothetical protein [Streptomyces pilosus]GGQ82647.1 hypothetical protein GCM10010280_31900 [Streptomyces pilosus]GGV50406.1 hypothetical protein GCM10010261_28920 [Streptomyces pilosus]
MHLAPHLPTAELSEADLDAVAGGRAGAGAAFDLGVHAEAGALGVHLEAGGVGLTAGVGASVSPQGLAVDGHLHATLY